jgi:hypothetical protein
MDDRGRSVGRSGAVIQFIEGPSVACDNRSLLWVLLKARSKVAPRCSRGAQVSVVASPLHRGLRNRRGPAPQIAQPVRAWEPDGPTTAHKPNKLARAAEAVVSRMS